MEAKRIMVVYFTRTGTTRKVAEELARILDADCEELIDRRSYKGIFGFINGGRLSATKKMTKLMPIRHEPINYDLIVICSPIWAGNITPAALTYITTHKPNSVAWVITTAGDNSRVSNFATEADALKGYLHLSNKEINSQDLTHKLEAFAAKLKDAI